MEYYLLILSVILVGFIISQWDLNKLNKRLDRVILLDKRRDETYKFLMSEEGEVAERSVSSLCNELGIPLESDNQLESESEL